MTLRMPPLRERREDLGLLVASLLRRLRADGRTQRIPVLAITGYGDRHYPDRVLIAGANRVLTKPCEPERLVDEARRLIQSA